MRMQTIFNVTAAAILVAVVAKIVLDWNAAKRAVYEQQLASSNARADSLKHMLRVTDETVRTLKLRIRADSIRLASRDDRITIREPSVIDVDTSYRHPESIGAPAMEIFVPPEVTDLIVAQRVQIRDLRLALDASEKQWSYEHALRLEREREIEVLKKINRPRFGVKTGVVLGVLATSGIVLLVQQ